MSIRGGGGTRGVPLSRSVNKVKINKNKNKIKVHSHMNQPLFSYSQVEYATLYSSSNCFSTLPSIKKEWPKIYLIRFLSGAHDQCKAKINAEHNI